MKLALVLADMERTINITSALELLAFYCFRILLVYPCPLYYGMLILSRAHGACPTPMASTRVLDFPQVGVAISLQLTPRSNFN